MSEPIRVLQVFARMNRGGAESMLMNLYRNIDRTKVQFDFVVHTDEECAFDQEIRALGGRIFSVPRYNGKNHFGYVKAWKTFFKEHPEYKIVHGHIYSVASIYLKIAKQFGCTTVVHSHSTSDDKKLAGVAKKILQYPLRHRVEWLFACSDKAGEWLYGTNCTKRKNYVLLKNAVDTELYKPDKAVREKLRNELGIADNFVIGHVGRFNIPKNHAFLIDVFKSVYDENKNARLLLVGDGNLRAEIEEKINALGLKDAVIMAGVRTNVNEFLQAMDCFVFPSLFEGLPVTVIEAQSAGLRCFISDTITDEVCVTELVRQLPINSGTESWKKELLGIASGEYEQRDVLKDIVDAGYDIHTTSRWLEDFYIQKCGKGE